MDDLISRQAAIDAICEHGTDLERRGVTVLAVANHKQVTVDLLEQLPSVQPRKGKWIGYKADDKDWQRDDGSHIFMNCSECHEAVINNGSAHWNFCPNCGSYNGGEEDVPESIT